MSQEIEQNQMDQFDRLMELSFLREKRKQMKSRLQFEERDIERISRPTVPSIKGIKFQKQSSSSYDRFKFRSSSQILEEQGKAKQQKIKKIAIYITLIIIALAAILFYFSK
jgi:23S rRNA maturation-related 3'-5' exoribonuclease YhaM